jgi:hypothetical protein
MLKNVVNKLRSNYTKMGQIVGSAMHAPSRSHMQIGLFTLGVGLLAVGMTNGAVAQVGTDIEYNDERLASAVARIFAYLEGSMGALVMVVSGLGAIMSAALGQYRTAMGCLVVAVGSFILRSVLNTFFNTETVNDFVE